MGPIRNGKQRGPGAVRALSMSACVLLACSEQAVPTGQGLAPQLDLTEYSVAPATLGWQQQARTLVSVNNLSPLAAGRVYALLSVAQYGAIGKVDGSRDGTLPEHGLGDGGRALFEMERGAITGASWPVLAFFFPNAASALEQRAQDEANARGTTHPNFQRGLEIGRDMAAKMIERARNDHFTDPWTGSVPVGEGKWRNNGPPVGPLFGTVTPYLLTSPSQFRPPPPPAFNSPAFLTDLNEISALSAARTPEQLAIARFWNFPTGSFTPFGYWNQLAGTYIDEYRLNEHAAARVFALVEAASMDAMIGCWDAKYFYWFIRPSQVNSSITLPIGLPNHPSYPSGHSCNSSAATTVLAHFFPAHAAELASQLELAGLSRMYAGIHYRSDITAAVELGTAVGQMALAIDQGQGFLSRIARAP
jgi:membrane-associated phospholipid phosphatase